jgi:ATP-binding cassette subfamily A (ABC1) protein 3
MAAVGVFSFTLVLLVEYRVFDFLLKNRFTYFGILPQTEDDEMDSDVQAEKQRVEHMGEYEIKANNLVIRNMTKFYKKFLAVNQISVGVDKSECFGLLGVNGAGKTSSFKMLTGDVSISSGSAWVKGISLLTDMNEVHKRIGYCPQFDGLLEELTGRETLRLIALLRGVPEFEIERISLKLAQDLNFLKHIDKQIKDYSGGNKRKLSTALAIVGDPAIIFLDEPTSGLDIYSKRVFWNMMCKIRNSGKTIILTSHSMEECEALCTRLAIMVNGEFKCIGSTQHLKNKFSKGYILTIKLKKSDAIDRVLEVKKFVADNFEGSHLKEEYQDTLTYHITQSELKWSTMFALMEEGKKNLAIEDYALGQTTLEQVFLFFTKYQRHSDE